MLKCKFVSEKRKYLTITNINKVYVNNYFPFSATFLLKTGLFFKQKQLLHIGNWFVEVDKRCVILQWKKNTFVC